MKKRHTAEHIIGFLHEGLSRVQLEELAALPRRKSN
jgi:hypothetical protein